MKKKTILKGELGVCKTVDFGDAYKQLSNGVHTWGSSVPSRNGETRELLNFKTILTSPLNRCVGVEEKHRKINIFFLLAEAMWIWTGCKDVGFLEFFNSGMKNYSDDGVNFHAPYGFRLRSYGVSSFDHFSEENKHFAQSTDQIEEILHMLAKDPNDRRCVASIWNPDLDLNYNFQSKDIPCNDMLMFKMRENALHLTVQNRSNDLHWGLTTNVFQFSWILESMAWILQAEVGTQVHNSQSLHVYLENPLTTKMLRSGQAKTLYDYVTNSTMQFSEPAELGRNVTSRLGWVDATQKCVVDRLRSMMNNSPQTNNFPLESDYFKSIFSILTTYVTYKHKTNKLAAKVDALKELVFSFELLQNCEDFYFLALNWFAADLTTEQRYEALGVERIFVNIDNSKIGDF